MWESLSSKIQETFESIAQVQLVIPHPIDNLDQLSKYPAVVWFPFQDENAFETNVENMETYSFRAFVFIQANQATNLNKIFTDAMPKTVDAIKAKFNEQWDGGTINGHRIWIILETGAWDVDATSAKGKVGFVELHIKVKGLTTN